MHMTVWLLLLKVVKILTLEFYMICPMGHPHLFLYLQALWGAYQRRADFQGMPFSHLYHSGSKLPARPFGGSFLAE